tara:strand:+ start:5721 stop:6800 length:1080 start_codon:yes stop_codon:yes gene_type:complete
MRLEPYTAGERDFEEWLEILGNTFGTYEEQRRQGYRLRTRDVVDRELNFKRDRPAEGGSVEGNPANYNVGQTTVGIAGDECQADQGLPKSIREGRLKGYVRAAAFPDTPKGKKAATNYADKLGTDFEGSLYINVRRGYCRDSRQNIWGVWVKPTPEYTVTGSRSEEKPDGEKMILTAPHKNKRGGRTTGDSRAWTEYRGKAKKAVRCPKCEAPKDFPCVNDKGIAEGVYMKDGKPIPTETANETLRTSRGFVDEIRSVRTNAHRERVDAYFAKKGKTIEGVSGKVEKKREMIEPTSRQKVRWIMQRLNEGQMDRYEVVEDEGGWKTYDAELDFLLSDIINKKQRVKFDQYVEKGVPSED